MFKKNVSDFVTKSQANYNIPEEILYTFIEKNLNLHPVSRHKLIQGYANEVYKINTKEERSIIVRIGRQGEGNYLSESWAIGEAKKVGVPVADILFVGTIQESGKDYPIMIQTFIEGEPLIDFLQSANKEDLRKAYSDLGRLMYKLHSVGLPGFSTRLNTGQWACSSWGEMISKNIERRQAEEDLFLGAGFTKKEFGLMVSMLLRYKELPDKSVLCHGDLGPDHIFINKEFKVVGLIDFGMFQGNSPVVDFFYIFINDGMEFVEWMKEGYESKEFLNNDFELRLNLNALLMLMEDLSRFSKIQKVESVDRTIKSLRKIIGNLDLL